MAGGRGPQSPRFPVVRAGGRRGAAAVLARPEGAGDRMGAARIQPRADHPDSVVLHVPARGEVRAAAHGSGDRPLARRGGDRAGAGHGRGRQSGAHRRHRLLRADRLDGRPDPDRLRLLAGLGVLALGAASGVHAAAAAVPLLEAQHRAAVHLLGDRRLAGGAGRGAGLSRRQRHRSGRLQAAGRRGLLGPALPLPDHELLLRLRGALPRPGLAQDRAAARRRCRWRC